LLLIFWLCEAGIILAAGVLAPIKGLFNDEPVCRECGAKCELGSRLPRFSADRQEAVIALVENRQFDLLPTHEAPDHEDAPELSLRLLSCPTCQSMHVLTLNHIAWEASGSGPLSVKTRPLVRQLLITPDE